VDKFSVRLFPPRERESGQRIIKRPGTPVMTNAAAAANERIETDPFVADMTRLLLTFLCVVALDAVFVSLLTHRLRFWFPL